MWNFLWWQLKACCCKFPCRGGSHAQHTPLNTLSAAASAGSLRLVNRKEGGVGGGSFEAGWGGRIRRVRRSSTLHHQQLLTGPCLLTNCQGWRSPPHASHSLTHTHSFTNKTRHAHLYLKHTADRRAAMWHVDACVFLVNTEKNKSRAMLGISARHHSECHSQDSILAVRIYSARLADWTRRAVSWLRNCSGITARKRELPLLLLLHSSSVSAWQAQLFLSPSLSLFPSCLLI